MEKVEKKKFTTDLQLDKIRKKSMKKQNIRESSRLKSQENTKMNSAYEDTIVTAPILTQFQKHRRLATMENLQAK